MKGETKSFFGMTGPLGRGQLATQAAVLLPVYVAVALWNPDRPPQDRLAGTYLVPL